VALDEVFLLGSLIKIGEVSALYAAPNVDKTLMTIALLIDSIRLGRINPALVYCVNADDNLNGLIQKLRIADEFDFHMLAEGHLDFKVTDLPDLMDEAIANDQARGVVMIIDTAKKVTNLMDKTRVSNFTALMRRFVGAGVSADELPRLFAADLYGAVCVSVDAGLPRHAVTAKVLADNQSNLG